MQEAAVQEAECTKSMEVSVYQLSPNGFPLTALTCFEYPMIRLWLIIVPSFMLILVEKNWTHHLTQGWGGLSKSEGRWVERDHQF